MKPYYNQSAEDVQKQINGGMEPLSDSKVKENQEKYGFNFYRMEEGMVRMCRSETYANGRILGTLTF